MEDSGGGAASREKDVVVVGAAEDQRSIAGGVESFGGEGGWFGGWWEFGPLFAVFGVEDGEFAVDWIADGEAILFVAADEAVEKEGGARVGVLYAPGSAGVGRFVDVGFVFGADGKDVGDVGAEAADTAEVLGAGIVDGPAGPGFAPVGGADDYAVGAGGPDDLRIVGLGRGEAAEAGIGAGVRSEGRRKLRG